MELINRFKTCQAGRKVTERNITYLYIKWHGESEVGTLSSKARTRQHQIKLLSIRLKPKEVFCIRLKRKKCFISCTQLSCRMPCARLWWLLEVYVGSKSKWTWQEKFRQYLGRRIQTIPDQIEAGWIFRGSGVTCLPFLTFLSMHLLFFTLEKIYGVCVAILVFILFASVNTFSFADIWHYNDDG